MCQRKFHPMKYTRHYSYTHFGTFILGHPVVGEFVPSFGNSGGLASSHVLTPLHSAFHHNRSATLHYCQSDRPWTICDLAALNFWAFIHQNSCQGTTFQEGTVTTMASRTVTVTARAVATGGISGYIPPKISLP